MALGTKIKDFGKTPVGFVLYLALIVLLSGFFVGEMGIPVGALMMLLVAFGLPIYFGWKTSLKKMLAVAAAVLIFSPLIVGIVITQVVAVPSPISSSNDNVLQNATVTPFEGNSGNQPYTFHVQVWPSHAEKGVRVDGVYLWVTNCEYDNDHSTGNCLFSGKPVFQNYTMALLTPGANGTQNATGGVSLNLTPPNLPGGQILYFMFLTNVSSVNASSVSYYAEPFTSPARVGGWSCTIPQGYVGCYYTQGPITTNWGGVFLVLLPDFYLSMLLLVAVLVAVILIYTYLKGRERLRLARAKAAAAGEEVAAAGQELRCPHCGAVVDKGESTCWKCKKGLAEPPTPKVDKADPSADKGTPLATGAGSSSTGGRDATPPLTSENESGSKPLPSAETPSTEGTTPKSP